MTPEELVNRFTCHELTEDQVELYEEIQLMALTLATVVYSSCPDNRERSLAMTKIEEAVMWANAAIARNEDV